MTAPSGNARDDAHIDSGQVVVPGIIEGRPRQFGNVASNRTGHGDADCIPRIAERGPGDLRGERERVEYIGVQRRTVGVDGVRRGRWNRDLRDGSGGELNDGNGRHRAGWVGSDAVGELTVRIHNPVERQIATDNGLLENSEVGDGDGGDRCSIGEQRDPGAADKGDRGRSGSVLGIGG